MADLAGNMTDVITRHGHDGRIMFASPNADAVLGMPAGELQGHGLFERIHVADRPAFLGALSDAAASRRHRMQRGIEFRLRQRPRSAHSGDGDAAGFIWMRCAAGRSTRGNQAGVKAADRSSP